MDSYFIIMVNIIMDNGNIIKNMDKGSGRLQKEIFILVIGIKAKYKAKEFILLLTVKFILFY